MSTAPSSATAAMAFRQAVAVLRANIFQTVPSIFSLAWSPESGNVFFLCVSTW